MHQRIDLRDDGSIVVEYKYRIPESAVPLLTSIQNQVRLWQNAENTGNAAAALPLFMQRREVERYFSAAGCQLLAFDITRIGEVREVHVSVRADDAVRALNSGVFGDFTIQPEREDRWVLRADLAVPDSHRPVRLKSPVLRELCTGLVLRLDMLVPGTMIDTTASERSGRRASWLFQFGSEGEHPAQSIPPIRVTFRPSSAWKARRQ